jgi:tetratricopeptide (TPR) repeat protein
VSELVRRNDIHVGVRVRLSGVFRGTGLVLFSANIAVAMQGPFEDCSPNLLKRSHAPNIRDVLSGDGFSFTRSDLVSREAGTQSQTSGSELTRAEQLIHGGKYQEAYDLLAPLETSLSGDSTFNYLLGHAALGTGQVDKAKMYFERSIELMPDWIAPHLGLGRAYVVLGDYPQAKIEFETVLRFDNLPPDLLTQVEIYDKAAKQYLDGEKHLIGFAFVEAGAGHYWEHNTAITSASEEDNDLRKDPFLEGRSGIGLDQALSKTYLLDGNLDYQFRTFHNVLIRNDSDWRWVGQISRTLGESNLALGTRGWISNRGNGYRNDYGVFGSWRYRLNSINQLSIELRVWRRSYPSGPERDLSRNIGEIRLGWTHTLSDRVDLSITANGSGSWQANIPDGDRSVTGLSGRFNMVLTRRLDVIMLGLWQHHDFNENREHFNPVLDTVGEFSRTDNEYELGGGVVWDLQRGWSLRPQFLYTREASNVPINDYHSTELRITVRKNYY